ncbi:MAG: hypothetical protein U0528_10990 [Anaerolineae bacterium]|nr:hypothetical protein [Anaerolineae bacterium]
MPHTVFIHLMNQDPVMMDVDELPKPSDYLIVGQNPRRRDGKDVPFILGDVTTVYFPIHQISFIELMPSGDDEEVFRPFRDS